MRLFGKEYRVAIFDVDGVILDLMACYWSILAAAAKEFGLPLAPVFAYKNGHYAGTYRGNPRLRPLFHSLWPHLSEYELDRFRVRFRGLEEKFGYPQLYGSMDAIAKFRVAGARTIFCTMNDDATMAWKLKRADIPQDAVDHIVTRETAGFEKPDPRMLDVVWEETGFGPGDAMYVGDWYVDHELARQAGVDFFAVLTGGVPKSAFKEDGVPESRIFNCLIDIAKHIEL